MFPNPQDAFPVPPHPDLEQYRTLAKELVKACRSDHPDAMLEWARAWLTALGRATGAADAGEQRFVERMAREVAGYAAATLKQPGKPACRLASAQHVLARSHGFLGWPLFTAHLDRLASAGTDIAEFEAAADAIIGGDEPALRRLLAAHPGLTRARSSREHGATLLHYASANGVEGYRQVTPPNILAITRILLDAGAEVNAEADVYGGGCTTLGLVATSAHPRAAGVQIPLLELLLERGARIEDPPTAGNDQGAVLSCLANGCPEAAEYLAQRGARLGVETAAALGRLDVVRSTLEAGGVSPELEESAFMHACGGGKDDIARYLLDRGANPAAKDEDDQTALHWAVMGAHVSTMQLLIEHGAPLEHHNRYGGTPLGQALWCAAHNSNADDFIPVVEALLTAGARPGERHPPTNPRMDALLELHGSRTDPSRHWIGE